MTRNSLPRSKALTGKKEGEEVAVRQLPRQFGGSTLPEECGSDRHGVVVDLLTDLVFGYRRDVLSLYFLPICVVVAGEADPGLVVLNQATAETGKLCTKLAVLDLERIACTGGL